MPELLTETVHWHPTCTIEKYSPDQTAFAQRQIRHAREWGRVPRTTIRQHQDVLLFDLHGDWLRELFPEGPEGGILITEGNLLTDSGLSVMVKLLTGAGGSTWYPLQNNGSTNNTVVGVGSNGSGTGAAAAVTDTALHDDNLATCYYQGMDASYPSVSLPNVINGQCTFGGSVANYSWNEWCWATGAGAVTAGDHLSSVFATGGTVNMINHKVNLYGGNQGASLGPKGAGFSWVFQTSVSFS